MTDIIVPWRKGKDHWRQKSFDYISQHMHQYNVIAVDSKHDPFSRAASKNLGATLTDQDVLFFLDADMYIPTNQIDEAIERARLGGICVSFSRYVYLSGRSTELVYKGFDPLQVESVYTVDWSVGGAVAISRDIFPGYDEEFVGWGMEDVAIVQYLADQGYDLQKVEGYGAHLYHPGHEVGENEKRNEERYRRVYLKEGLE